jgi:hypothetical protein
MPAFSVSTKIIGEDGLSEVFRKVGAAARSAWHPVTMFNKAVGEPSTNALGRLGAKVDGVAGKFRSGLGSISAWLPALGAIGSALTLGGLVEMTRRQAEGYEDLTLGAQKLGSSTRDLAVWRFGAKLAGVENEKLDKGLVKLNKTMYDAATGKNKDVAALFRAMKIPLRDAHGQIKSVGNSLEDVAEAFKNTENPAMRDAAAMALFGKAGADLLPFLLKGRAGIADLRAEMAKYSGLTDENREALEHLAGSYKRLDKAGSGLSAKLSAVFAPALSLVVDGTTDWIVANRDLLALSLEHKLTGIGNAIKYIGTIGREVASMPFVGEMIKGADAGTAFDIGLAGLGITMAGPLLAGIQVVTAAIWRMNVALYANPWVLVAAAAVYAAYELHRHWDDIAPWWTQTMDKIHAASERGFGPEVWETYKQGMLVLPRAVSVMVKDLTGIDLFAIGRAWIAGLIAGIKSMLPDLKGLTDRLAPITDWVSRNTVALPHPAAASDIASGYAKEAAAGSKQPAIYGMVGDTTTPAATGNRGLPFDPLALAVNNAAPPPPGKVDVTIDFTNVPRGVEVKTSSSNVGSLSANVGRSMDDH